MDEDIETAISEAVYLRLAAARASAEAAAAPQSVDPDLAAFMGSFLEDALSYQDAMDSSLDGADPEQEVSHG